MPRDVTGRIQPASREIDGQSVRAYGVDASPALAVDHAIVELASRRPALVVSGINFGANLGIEVTISGTVGAALEASAFGIPAMAVSLEMGAAHHLTGDADADYAATKAYIHLFASYLLARALPRDVDILNINIPADATTETPWRLTGLSRRRYFLPVPPDRSKGDGRPGYKLIENVGQAEPESDIRALLVDRVISVTPLSLDLTSRVHLDTTDRRFPARSLSELFAKSSCALGIPAPFSRPSGGNGRSGLRAAALGTGTGMAG
jgi:5'-nucleotidase